MSPELLLAVIAVFGSVALATGLLVSYTLTQTTPARRRLQQAQRASAGSGVVLETTSLTPEHTEFVKRLTTLIPRSPREMSRLRRHLVRAGYHDLGALAVYSAAQLVCPIVLGVLPLAFARFSAIWPLMLVCAVLGFLLPTFVLDRMIAARQKVITNGLPDALDLLIVCLEAGSSLDQAILKVSDELEHSYPALAEEFRLLLTETRAGKPRLEAFRNLAERTGVDDVRALVAMLVQTDRFGTSVAQALRTHAETARTKRRQRAEERAAKIGVKLVFPLVFLLFPAFFTVTLGPAVIQFIRIFFGQIMSQQ